MKATFGKTPLGVLAEMRMNYAKQYLIRTNYDIQTIAKLVGFSSEIYFSNCFKQYVKVSPRHYRKQYEEKDQLSKIKGVKEKKQNGVLKKYARQQGMTKDHARGFNWKFKVSVDDKERYFLRRQT
jgi:hypothetical protein